MAARRVRRWSLPLVRRHEPCGRDGEENADGDREDQAGRPPPGRGNGRRDELQVGLTVAVVILEALDQRLRIEPEEGRVLSQEGTRVQGSGIGLYGRVRLESLEISPGDPGDRRGFCL